MTSYPPPPADGAGPPYNPPPPAYPAAAPGPYGVPAGPVGYSAPIPAQYAPAPTAPITVSPVAWLIPLAALLAVIGAATPWFKPALHKAGINASVHNALYSWKDGKVGLLAPILLVILAIGVVGLLRGKSGGRFSRGSGHPAKSAGRTAVIFGVVSLGCMVIAWFLVLGQYTIQDPSTGDTEHLKTFASAVGATLSRGPQIGFWLTGVAAVLAIVAGVVLMVTSKDAPLPPAPQPYQPQPYQPYQP
jgi:hypothetical protein